VVYGANHHSWGKPVPRSHYFIIEKETLKGGLRCLSPQLGETGPLQPIPYYREGDPKGWSTVLSSWEKLVPRGHCTFNSNDEALIVTDAQQCTFNSNNAPAGHRDPSIAPRAQAHPSCSCFACTSARCRRGNWTSSAAGTGSC
jgi:hypothetical protein